MPLELCCELLSNLYLCIGWHSRVVERPVTITVVNCFQICIFVSDDTASKELIVAGWLLWIAFKFVSLYRMTQHVKIMAYKLKVVNCFQICIFVSDDTADRGYQGNENQLWIAFKFVSLYRMTQLRPIFSLSVLCCELLSNLYLCIGWHSCTWRRCCVQGVVNCFQICIFVSDDTAFFLHLCDSIVLWIAFKFVSLYRMTQQLSVIDQLRQSCELLSNLYLCIGWHSTERR